MVRLIRYKRFAAIITLSSALSALIFLYRTQKVVDKNILPDHLFERDVGESDFNQRQVKEVADIDMTERKTKSLTQKPIKISNNPHYFDDSNKIEQIYPNLEELGMIKNEEDRNIKSEGNRLYAFNALISERLGFHRDIPDTRIDHCKTKQYNFNLPKASIIICFYNEALSALLRTVHSVLDRTPHQVLQEIVLVDDNSNLEHLGAPLEEYISKNLPNFVHLIRTDKREGLIRARIIGADKSSGQVLVFLDSHCEVNVGWLEPLLDRIFYNRTIVVTPIIDIINHDSFNYEASPLVKGGFNWGLHFKWDGVSGSELVNAKKYGSPIRSPTMAGGLFAIDHEYFNELGKYDPGLEIWGGENLELSFRIWMCGGSLEIIPCSRVGHIFRKRRPYGSLNGEDTMTKNSLRVASVWLDEYIENFYDVRPYARTIKYGDTFERLQLRKNLHCKTFKWYLENIYPEMLPSSNSNYVMRNAGIADIPRNSFLNSKKYYHGKYLLKHVVSGLCLEPVKDVTTKGSALWLQNCTKKGKRQAWYETEKQELQLAALLCLDSGEKYPHLAKCHDQGGSQQWHYDNKSGTRLYNGAAGMCLVPKDVRPNSKIILDICQNNIFYQWTFE